MSKFANAHCEVRLFIPLDSDVWEDFRESKAYASLIQGGLLMVHNANKKQTENKKS